MTSKVLIPRFHKDESSSEGSSNEYLVRTGPTPGRKRKLDHLTYEEKVQRKKLKNRVAAQTSRDRKKKQMDEMMVTIEQQAKKINSLEKRCDHLQNERDKITAKYEKLQHEHQKLKLKANNKNEARNTIPEEHKYTRNASELDSCVGSLSIKTEGSAESQKPLLKVTKMENESTKPSAHSQKKSDVKALLKIILLCLLYKNSSKISTSNSISKNLQKAFSRMSHQTWKQVFQEASLQLPKMKAKNSHCLNQWWGPATREWNPPKIPVS